MTNLNSRIILRLFSPCFFALLFHPKVTAQEARQDTLRELQRQIEILTEEIEKLKLGEVADPRYQRIYGLGPAAARVYQLKKTGVSIAGYGELIYENFKKTRDNNSPSNVKDQIDYLRNIVYVGFRFNDWILFNSEIEFEHGSTGKLGEVSVEFGYIDLTFSRNLNVRAGMVLVPVGIVNERHEPSTFHGTKRPLPEQIIIPTTWRATGAGLFGEITSGLNYRAYFIEGLQSSQFSASSGLRGGRQSGSKAVAEDLGLTGRLEYEGLRGATLGVSFYTGNSGQGNTDSLGTISVQTSLWSAHGEYLWKGFEFRGLYAQARIDEVDRINRRNGLTGNRTIGESMHGWYITVAFDALPHLVKESTQSLAPFVQFEKVNTQAEVPAGFIANPANETSILALGVTYKPHPNVAFKFDYRDVNNEAGTGVNQWNLAINYMF